MILPSIEDVHCSQPPPASPKAEGNVGLAIWTKMCRFAS